MVQDRVYWWASVDDGDETMGTIRREHFLIS